MSYIPPEGHAVDLVFVPGFAPSAILNFEGAGRRVTLAAALDGALQAALTLQGALGAAVVKALVAEASIDAAISPAGLRALLDGLVTAATGVQAEADAALAATAARQAQADAGLWLGQALNAAADGVSAKTRMLSAGVEAAAVAERVLAAALDAGLVDQTETLALSALADSALQAALRRTAESDAVIARYAHATVTADAALTRWMGRTAGVDAVLVAETLQHLVTAAISAVLARPRREAVYPDCAVIGRDTAERALRLRLDALIEPGEDMSLSFSTGLRNHLLGRYAHGTGDGLAGAMHNVYIDVYAGAKPASPDFPPVYGTYLGTFSQGGYSGPDWGGSWREPQNGTVEKSRSEPWVMIGSRPGTAGWFRCRLIDDLNDYSTTAHRIDGTIGLQGSGADLEVNSTTVAVGSQHQIDVFKMIMREDNG